MLELTSKYSLNASIIISTNGYVYKGENPGMILAFVSNFKSCNPNSGDIPKDWQKAARNA